jgi:hypothetical protein
MHHILSYFKTLYVMIITITAPVHLSTALQSFAEGFVQGACDATILTQVDYSLLRLCHNLQLSLVRRLHSSRF